MKLALPIALLSTVLLVTACDDPQVTSPAASPTATTATTPQRMPTHLYLAPATSTPTGVLAPTQGYPTTRRS